MPQFGMRSAIYVLPRRYQFHSGPREEALAGRHLLAFVWVDRLHVRCISLIVIRVYCFWVLDSVTTLSGVYMHSLSWLCGMFLVAGAPDAVPPLLELAMDLPQRGSIF